MQAYALVALNHLDVIDREAENVLALKRSMLANEKFDHKILFPEYFGDPTEKAEEIFDPEDSLDLSEVEWMSGTEAMAEFEKVMAALKGASSGTMTGDQMTNGPTWTDWS